MLEVHGPSLTLRYPGPADAPALFALASDPEVTRFFSWGPYDHLEQAVAFIASLPARREGGEALDFAVVHQEHGPIGMIGLNELSSRDRRAAIGTWLGRPHWGSGANAEAKALLARLAFEHLGLERLTAYAALENPRSQRALEKVGFTREGVLARWHRHGERVYDLAIYRLLADELAATPLAGIQTEVTGEAPGRWRLSPAARPN